ncbi:cellulose binding domain-containing protein [Streptomyces sp. NBRC 109706]|uniref:cellulose binding domain-containing protein n=1 Tax=Streptomyces sp. NBRC 109706 TaxID=1550035 RepID=UPI00099D76D7|nr:cellulose binding domain-containing protein [Streptomyces sp. NBRC 109706]
MRHSPPRARFRRRIAVLVTGLALVAGLGAAGVSHADPQASDIEAADAAVALHYRSGNGGATADQIEPWLKLVNTGDQPVVLSELTIRYYFKAESPGTDYRFGCSWAVVSCGNVRGSFGLLTQPSETADRYLEVGFSSGAGTLAPGTDTGDLQLRLHRADWQQVVQSDDYSFGAGQTSYGPWERITVRRDGELIWGTAPEGDEPGEPEEPGDPTGELFDDFDYSGHADPALSRNGWIVRTYTGGPGVPGASWPAENITFPAGEGGTVLNLESATDGTPGGTEQSELYTSELKFQEGTYAARVRFSDAPRFGPDGDHLVQTFFSINALQAPMDPDYAEYDFEYLPNGGWGEPDNILYATSWETYRAEPWEAVNTHTAERTSFDGWHDLVFTIDGQSIRYYLDGRLFAVHGEPYLPEKPMSINFNQWFIDLLGQPGTTPRAYDQQVDYVYFAADTALTPAQVTARIAEYRGDGVSFEDTVPAG